MKVRGFGAVAVLVAGCLGVVSTGNAEVSVPALIADQMVIQRALPVHVWGKADPGEAVVVTFQGMSARTLADDYGRWSVYLPVAKVGGPYDLEIVGSNTIRVRDVLVGDVWVGSGQSNMGFTTNRVTNAAAELAAANQPTIRLFHVPQSASEYPLDDVKASWAVCTPESVKSFSAVAYFFGRKIQEDQKVPIGLIDADFGGPAEAWTSMRALGADASLMPLFHAWAVRMEEETADVARDRMVQRLTEAAKAAGKPLPPPAPPRAGLALFGPDNLFNAMIAPLTAFRIRGVIWYQGESSSDSMRAPLYGRVFQTLIADWRAHWGEGDFPFLLVQLANFGGADPSPWGMVRNAQLQTLSMRNTGMAVANDIGNPHDIHPRTSRTSGPGWRWSRGRSRTVRRSSTPGLRFVQPNQNRARSV